MAEKAGGKLPPEVEELWSTRARPRRGPKPTLSLDEIVAAAMRIADTEGLDAVSMGRIAKDLGYTAMSLYRYVSSKSILLTIMLDQAIGNPPPIIAGESWREALERWSLGQLRVFGRHRWALQVSITGLTLSPHRLTWLDRGFQMLAETGLAEDEKAACLLLLSSYILGEARLMRDLEAEQQEYEPVAGAMPSFGQLMSRLVDAEHHPALVKAVRAGVFDDPGGYSEADTAFGLHRILDGIELLVMRKS